jgi:hypothetical protein
VPIHNGRPEHCANNPIVAKEEQLMTLRDRIGIDVGRRLRLEDAIEWAAEHEVHWIDIQLDVGANALPSLDETARLPCAGRAPSTRCISVCTPLRRSTSRKWRPSQRRRRSVYVEIAPRLGSEWCRSSWRCRIA